MCGSGGCGGSLPHRKLMCCNQVAFYGKVEELSMREHVTVAFTEFFLELIKMVKHHKVKRHLHVICLQKNDRKR